jgi:serine/threonine protein kinase
MVETGRVISKRYLLQRLLKQGHYCAVYQGSDQVLQRPVAVKVVPAPYISDYRAAIRSTAQFSHANIITIYDLIIEPEILYVVQEYVDGDDFAALLQTQQMPYQAADLGVQICQALLYASSVSPKVCHGDLTPSAIIRDRRGLVHINNFALPSDTYYFTNWSMFGGEGAPLADRELPWGQYTDSRGTDDTRAVGVLLYQLLAGRNPGITTVDPPIDGRLRFLRNVPPELCEVIARTVIRQHPQPITRVESLYNELKTLADAYEPIPHMPMPTSRGNYQPEDSAKPAPPPPIGTGKLVTALPMRETAQQGAGLFAYRTDTNAQPVASMQAPTIADVSLKLATARQAAYPDTAGEASSHRLSLPLLILIGIIVFALFFAIGYFTATHILP